MFYRKTKLNIFHCFLNKWQTVKPFFSHAKKTRLERAQQINNKGKPGGRKTKAKPRLVVTGAAGGKPLTKDQAKALLPTGVGININKDTKLHMRWNVSYPNPSAPFTYSRVWNEVRSDRESMMAFIVNKSIRL